MKVDGGLAASLKDVPKQARAQEEAGYDGLFSAETRHDPFLPLVLAAEHTERAELVTSIAVAFGRNPMTLAVTANDLHRFSEGRFVLGLGSQIKPHIEKRYSMPWSHPARRMREMVLAIRAIWKAWETGERLAFRGEFYTHTLMTPMFDPGPNPYGNPKIYVAAVGAVMTEVAAEVADGLLVHAFTTERYLREVTLPAVERTLAAAGRERADVELSYPGLIVSGETDEEWARAAEAVRRQIAFYGSTPAYRPVLELHGWGELADELNRLSKSDAADRWERMGQLIDDEVLDTFAIVAPPGDIADKVLARYGGVIDRFSFYTPYQVHRLLWTSVIERLRAQG